MRRNQNRRGYRRPQLLMLEDRSVPANFTVTSIVDGMPGSLRNVLASTNAMPDADVIDFGPTVLDQNLVLTAGPLSVTNPVTIQGVGRIIIDGDKNGRTFDINTGAGAAVTISGIKFVGGLATGNGGAILTQNAKLVLDNVTLFSNSATENGGAAFVQSGSLTVTNSLVFGSRVTGGGGAHQGDGGAFNVNTGASLTIVNSELSGNVANDQGGAVYFFDAGSFTLMDSTITGSFAANGRGGAIYWYGAVAADAFLVRNSTLFANTAKNGGGGVAFSNLTGNAKIQNSTVNSNKSTNGSGGGILHVSGAGTITIDSSVIAKNTNTSAPDISSAGTVSINRSAVSDSVGYTPTGSNNLEFGIDLKLLPFSNYGGLGRTQPPAVGSPLINAGSNPAGLANDAREGKALRNIGGAPDIGAIEYQTFVVSNKNDAGPNSLRQALTDAAPLGTLNTIQFDPAVFSSAQTITLTTGQLQAMSPVNIVGPGSGSLTINGNFNSRVFYLYSLFGETSTISGVTITNGRAATGDTRGAGILNTLGGLTLNNCVVSGNSATGNGGGIYLVTGDAFTLNSCVISGNTAASGGGLNTFSDTTLTNCTVSNNVSNGINGGGGIVSANKSLILQSTTVSNNIATVGNGGAIYVAVPDTGTIEIRNSTLAGNTAGTLLQGGLGGAMFLRTSRPVLIQNSTIAKNSSTVNAGGIYLFDFQEFGTVTLDSSIVSDNGPGNDLATAKNVLPVYSYFSAVGTTNASFAPSSHDNLPLGSNLKLGSLASNGGPTQTIALLAGSPAVNKGTNPASLTTDQRGSTFARVVDVLTDIGSFEVQTAQPPTATIAFGDGTNQKSVVRSITVTFSSAPTFVSGKASDAFQVARLASSQSPGGTGNVTLDVVVAGNVATITFNDATFAPATQGKSLIDGQYALTIFGNQVTGAGGFFDGNSDGIGGDSKVTNFHRLFGDIDGSGSVNLTDFGVFRSSFTPAYNPNFDYNLNGTVDLGDFGQFRTHFQPFAP